MKIALETLGCKLNQAETELLAGKFISAGHILTTADKADIVILNTCSVTHTADAKARQFLRKVHRLNPDAVLVATGCYVERAPEVLQDMGIVTLTIGNEHKASLPEMLAVAGLLHTPNAPDTGSENSFTTAERTRTFIKIQDGCSNFCTYCIVPFVRPGETSIDPETIIRNINERVTAGIKEAVLTGTEVGSYEYEGTGLITLLKRILDKTGIERLRLSSLQPDEITPELLMLWQNSRMCPHFHISLQSGSDAILKRMNRRYTVGTYLAALSLIRSMVPYVAVTTDIIAGFPGETEEDFSETVELCRKAGFARIHVFPYSKRPETAAAKMSGQVKDSVKTQRVQNLGAIATESALTFRKRFTGSTMDVLWEQESGGYWSGYTGNYIRVYTRRKDNLENRITPVMLREVFRDGMTGEIVV